MRKSKFTERVILIILKQGEAGAPVGDLCRKHAIVATTSCGQWNIYFVNTRNQFN